MFFTLSTVDLEDAESSSQDSSSDEDDSKKDSTIVKPEANTKSSPTTRKRGPPKGVDVKPQVKKLKTITSVKGSAVASKKGNTHLLIGVKPCDLGDGFDEIARADVTDKDALQRLFKKVKETPDGDIEITKDAQPNLNSQQDLSTTIE
jgi:hypothetical protein